MARIYVEKNVRTAQFGAGASSSSVQEYIAKIALMVPHEVVAAYMAVLAIAGPMESEDLKGLIMRLTIIAGLIATPLYLNMASKDAPPAAARALPILLSTIAFVVWTYAISGELVYGDYYNPDIARVMPILFTLLAGLIPFNRQEAEPVG